MNKNNHKNNHKNNYRCYKKYQQPVVERKLTISYNPIQLNLKITNCNLFFIAENKCKYIIVYTA